MTADVVVAALQRFPDAVVTDVASVKTIVLRELWEAAEAGTISPADLARYVGSHPMAGRERSGAAAADPDLFASLKNLISVLQTPVETDADQANLNNTLSTASRQLSNAQDNVLTVQTSVGSRLNQLEVLDTIGDDLALSYTERLSGLVDADYTESVTEYTALQVALQAAQQTFVSLQKMSLFEYI